MELADVEEPDDFAAINGVASQAVGMPRQDAIGNAVLYVRKHFVEYGTTRSFRRLLLDVCSNYFYALSRRQLVKLRDLVVNTPHLPLLRVGGLAGIEKKLFGLSSIHILKN